MNTVALIECLIILVFGTNAIEETSKEYTLFHVLISSKSHILEKWSIVQMLCEIHNSSVEFKGILFEGADDFVTFDIGAKSFLQLDDCMLMRKRGFNKHFVFNEGTCELTNTTLNIEKRDYNCDMTMMSLVKMEGDDSSLLVRNSEWKNIVFCGSGSILRSGKGSFEGIKNCVFSNITMKFIKTDEMTFEKVTMMKMSITEDCSVESSMNVLEGGIVSGTEGSIAFSCNNCTFFNNKRVDWRMGNTERNSTTETQTYKNAEWNECSASCGGALYVHDNSSATLTVENSSLVKCNATSTKGGGIYAFNIAKCSLKSCFFEKCICFKEDGGSVEMEGITMQVFVENSKFKDGWAFDDAGGLCSLYHGGGLSLQTVGFGGELIWFCIFHNNSATYGNDIFVEDNSTNSQVAFCYSTRIEGVRYYAGGDKSYWLPNNGGRKRFVASVQTQPNAKDTFSCGLNESCSCFTISHCLSQMISGFVEEIKVLSGTVVEGKGVDIGEKTIFVNGVSPAGSAIETQFESNGLSLFCVGTGELTVSDLSVVHNSSLENNRRSILFEVQGAGGINLERLNISMDADHSEERSIQNSLVKMEGGSLKMKGVRWGQTFSTTSAISLPQGSSVSLSLDNCTFSNIVRTTAGSSLMNVGEGSYSITLDGCTIDGCGSEDSEFGGGMMIEMGNVGSLTMNGGIVRNCYASTTQGRGGGVGLKVRDINVEFLVSSAFEGNRAKWGSDIFIDSIDLETTAKSGKIASLTDSLETKSKMQGFENGDESFPIPLCVFLWNNFSAPAFVGGGSLSHDFSMCGFKEFPCSTIEKAASVHFEGKKKDITIFESFAFEDEVSLRTDEWNIKANQNEMKCGVADLTDGTQSGLIENSVSVSMTSIVFSLIQSLSSHESVFECHSGKLTLNKCGMEGGTDSISTVFVSVVGGAVEVIEFSTVNIKKGDSSFFIVEGSINSRPSLNITNSDFGEITFGNGCVVECHNGNIEKITGCTFSSITRSKGSGGCISIMNGHDGSDYKAEINDCTFEGCSVEGEEEEIGGGAFFYKASTNTNLLMSECEFYYCTALHEGEEVGYGGGIMLNLLSEMGEATFVISSPTFSSDKQNNAKYGKDLFVSSLSLISSIKNETLPFVKDRLEILTEDSMKGYDGGNRECAIPLIYFWKEVGSSVFVAEEGNNVVVCGLLEYPCGSVDYGMRRGGSLGIESIAIQGTCDVRTEMSVSGMRLEGTNGETDKIQFVKIIEGDKDAVVECKGVVQFKEVGILIPSAFDNEANILVQTGTDAIKTTIAGCSIHISDNAEGELTFVLISATKGIVEIEKTKMAGLASMHEIMSISVGCVITVSDVSFEEISLSRKSAIVMNENEIPENGNDNAEEEWNVLFEQCLFLNVKHSVLSNPSLLFCDVPNEMRLKMENSTIDKCGSASSNEGGCMFFLLDERGGLEMNHTNVTECFCSNNGRGGGLFLKTQSVAKKSLPFVLSNITFKENVALKGRDVFVKSIDLDSQISESQFLINFGEPFVKELAIWGCTADDYGDEEDLLGRVYVFRSEFIFVSSIVGNSSNSKNCGEMKSACSSLNVGVSHIIPSDYSQLLIWNETILAGSCSAQKVTIKSMEASRNAEIKVNEMNLAGEGAVTTSESVRIEKVSFVFGVMQNVVCSCLIHQLNGSLILESVSFLSESGSLENSQTLFDFSLLVVENGIFEADRCSIGYLEFSKPMFQILCSERATFEDLTACNVQCTSSVIECGKSEKVIISKLAVTNISLQNESLISFENGHSSLVLSLTLSSFSNISRLSSGPCIICTAQHMTNFEMCNCSFHKCTSEPSKGSQVAIALTENILMDSCTFEGNLADNTEEINGVGNKICQWNGSVVDFSSSSVMMKDTTICNSSKGGMTVSGGNVMIEKGEFVNNNPSIDRYPSLRRNIICSDSGTLNVMSLKGGDGLKDNTSLWMSNDGCSFEGIISERASPFFIPVLESIEENEKGEEMEVVFKGKLLLPCNLSFMIVKQMGDEKQIEKYEFDESGYASETEVEGRLKREIIREAGDEAEVRVLILFGNAKNPSSTDPFILKNRSEPKANGDERIVEGGKEGKSYWLLIVIIMGIILLIVLIGFILFIVRWKKVKNEAEDLREIVNDNIRKDPKAFEMVTMEMSPEEQWRRAEREAEKKNDERMKKRVYDTNMQHSESSEHLLSESGSTEYILGRDSDKIPQWMLEKEEEDDDISRKRTPSPSISSTSTSDTTDSDSTFVRGEDLCPTTSSMSNLVDAMACSSPHEKLIVDLRDSLFMLLHGRNEKKEMAIGSLQEREMTAAQILFWVANLALHSFDEMENPLQSLGSLSPHIVLFSEHMVICIAMHSDCSSDSDTSSSISSSTVVTSASDDESDSLPSSAFEDDEDNRKECLRWKAPELLNGTKKHATKKTVVFSIGMMLWECLTLQIPFGEYEAETAGEKIKNGERPGMESIRGSEMCEAVENGLDGDPERRASLMQVKRYLVGHLPSGYTMATVSDAIAYCEGSEECGSEYIERSGVIVKLHSGSESEIQTRESSG